LSSVKQVIEELKNKLLVLEHNLNDLQEQIKEIKKEFSLVIN